MNEYLKELGELAEIDEPVKQQNNKTSLTLSRYCLAAGIWQALILSNSFRVRNITFFGALFILGMNLS